MEPERLRLHHFMPTSRANGPGLRAVVWVQGCTLSCPGCFNPLTHPNESGEWVKNDWIADRIRLAASQLEGITITGGEPFQQVPGLAHLLDQIASIQSLSTIVFSGYSLKEILKIQGAGRVLDKIDVLIAGRYIEKRRVAAGLLGSNNKTIHLLTNRYTLADFLKVPDAEIILEPDGNIVLSGINPLQW